MSALFLHHYDRSPYSEKIRALFGYKRLAWRSVVTPMIMPKPDLVALTGGYRRVPVLQIGADVYCDSALIADEIERRFPSPALPRAATPWGPVVEAWADTYLFWKVGRYVTGVRADDIPEAFARDRAAMMRAPVEPQRAKEDLPQTRSQLGVALGWIDSALARAPYVGGDALAQEDLGLYASLWFLQAGGMDAARHPHVAAWMARIAALGHGAREEATAAEAHAAARAHRPEAPRASSPDATGIAPGDRATITAETFGTESVSGVVTALDAARVTLLRETELGPIAVHFPRFQYVLRRA